jgi:acid stress chaperone HdeA
MKNYLLGAIGVVVVLANYAIADTPTMSKKPAPAAAKSTKTIKPLDLTCAEFLSYDEVTRPQIVYWSEALNGKGKPESATIDLDRIKSLIPVLVEDCRQTSGASYWTKMKQEFKKIF